jgi:hypothetical protein
MYLLFLISFVSHAMKERKHEQLLLAMIARSLSPTSAIHVQKLNTREFILFPPSYVTHIFLLSSNASKNHVLVNIDEYMRVMDPFIPTSTALTHTHTHDTHAHHTCTHDSHYHKPISLSQLQALTSITAHPSFSQSFLIWLTEMDYEEDFKNVFIMIDEDAQSIVTGPKFCFLDAEDEEIKVALLLHSFPFLFILVLFYLVLPFCGFFIYKLTNS